VSNIDLVFDSVASLNRTLNFNQGGQNVTVNLDMASNRAPTAISVPAGRAAVHYDSNGITVNSQSGDIGYSSGSTGVVTVAGFGSTWINSGQLPSVIWQRMLNINGGGTVTRQVLCRSQLAAGNRRRSAASLL